MRAVNDAIQDRVSQGWIADHLMMPQMLTGESLRSGWLIRITRFMAVAFPSVIVARVVVLV
jgi:hypothetical protein